MYGHKRGLNRILGPDGRTLIVAMDHAAGLRNILGLRRPDRVIEQVIRGGTDAILATFGTACRFVHLVGPRGLILSVNNEVDVADYAVEQALRLGADAIKVEAFPDSPSRPLTMSNLYHLAAVCTAWNMTLMAEMIPVSFSAKEEHTPENIARAARMGAEAGADLVKVHYTGSADSFQSVVENCYVPIVILGGPRTADDAELLQAVEGALRAGAAGVAFGRHIWEHPDPEGITRALAAVIHRGASIEAALQEVKVSAL